jgi:endonuclease YncB( thermonuclease family)
MRFLAAACLVLACSAASADGWKVVSVHDGDTLKVLQNGQQTTIRLQGIDAPEIGQPFGSKSRDRLAELTMGKMVVIQADKPDQYGRLLGTVEVNGENVNRQMIADGLAWHYTRYSKDSGLASAERAAREARRGLWADARPVPPWEWRAKESVRPRMR